MPLSYITLHVWHCEAATFSVKNDPHLDVPTAKNKIKQKNLEQVKWKISQTHLWKIQSAPSSTE